MQNQKTLTPWHIFLPVVAIIGLAVSIWGGIELNQHNAQVRRDQQVAMDTQRMADLQVAWSRLEGAMLTIPSLYHASNQVTAAEFARLRDDLKGHFPFIYSVSLVDQHLHMANTDPVIPEGDTNADLASLRKAMAAGPVPEVLVVGASHIKGPQNAHLVDVLVPLGAPVSPGEEGYAGVVQVNLNTLVTKSVWQSWPKGLGLDLSVSALHNTTGKPLFADAMMPLEAPYVSAFSHVHHESWGGRDWAFTWHLSQQLLSPPKWPGQLLMLLGGLMTMIICWTLWSQQSLARRVQREVVERTYELEQASRRFRLITDNAYDLIAILDRDFAYEYINSAYNRVLGYARKEMMQNTMLTYTHPADKAALREVLDAVVGGTPAAELTFRMAHQDGQWVYLEAVAKGLYDDQWNLTSVVIHCRDVTSRRKSADDLARSEQRFRDFADASADWLWEVDQNYAFSYMSPGVKSVLGYGPDEMIGRSQFNTLFGADEHGVRDLLENMYRRRQSYRDLEIWTRTKMGERVCLRISGVPVLDGEGEFMGYRGVATNVTTSKLDQENMLRLATTDHLTGLLNRSRFMEELERTVALAQRYDSQGVLLFVDLDRFKAVNDTHGHDAGDEIIRAFAQLLRETMRQTDIIARLAGDEFAVIMHDVSMADARKKVQDLVKIVGRMRVNYKGAKLQVTMSVGMVAYPQAGKDASQLITSADLAMYRAKEMGRNRMFVDEDGASSAVASSSARDQLEWVDRLRMALEQDTFEMHYQPIVPTGTNRMVFEALVRVRDENGQLGLPGNFIDAAEHFGIIQQLDLAVIERCVRTQSELAAQGADFMLSINLSGLSLGDPEVLKKLKSVIRKYKANPGSFIFEVTETAAMRDMADAKAFVQDLKGLGCKFALDDFGVGFSSFFYIKHLDPDFIKIDGSYIRAIDKSREDRLFVQALIDLARGLDITTIAEFVETKEVLDTLKDMHVNYVQGYYLDRPGPDLKSLYEKFSGRTA